jgi:hypothetical protein
MASSNNIEDGPYVPGGEGKFEPEDIEDTKELIGFMSNSLNSDLSRIKGHAYVFRMDNLDSNKLHIAEQIAATNMFVKGTSLGKLPAWRYPKQTTRLFGVIFVSL